ncbi:MarR family winged helix-turn-helix transcriptional regulator [Arthrobacter cryoconiti]|uniref:MarR family winged helix-turn-helix transcriptional regulator n=1 Tax=Arthrobacter cryoconiti TaxID=748907 RepID=A0ABV8QX74_9MICC|nr:MarR family transcriptional regulator [Arthrobacter cryoconiti]MCC9068692.1 MarR family transcriptional regulator [Arthrobacter cryoconiti]
MEHTGKPPMPQMHPATLLIRQVLVLGESIEYAVRREMGLNETDFQAMQHLMKDPAMSPGELAAKLHLTAAATTTVVDRLIAKGHVMREPHPTDRRRWLIKPSDESVRKTMATIMPMILKVDAKVRGYSEESQESIVDFFENMVDYMNERIDCLEQGREPQANSRKKATAEGDKYNVQSQ